MCPLDVYLCREFCFASATLKDYTIVHTRHLRMFSHLFPCNLNSHCNEAEINYYEAVKAYSSMQNDLYTIIASFVVFQFTNAPWSPPKLVYPCPSHIWFLLLSKINNVNKQITSLSFSGVEMCDKRGHAKLRSPENPYFSSGNIQSRRKFVLLS